MIYKLDELRSDHTGSEKAGFVCACEAIAVYDEYFIATQKRIIKKYLGLYIAEIGKNFVYCRAYVQKYISICDDVEIAKSYGTTTLFSTSHVIDIFPETIVSFRLAEYTGIW